MSRILIFFLASLLVHIFLLSWFEFPHRLGEKRRSELELELRQMEVADIFKPMKEERPKKAKFSGLYDSKVEKETVAPSTAWKGRLPDPNAEGGLVGERGHLPEDFYPDFQKGAHTYLNVLRHPDIAYFVRLKRAFKLAFNPGPVLREELFGARISQGFLQAVVGVTVDKDGELAEVFLFRESGIKSYDEEVLRTVRASAPFSMPPAYLLSEDMTLRMSWTFTVYF